MFQQLDVRKLPSPILIVSPHPDDDILSSGGLIQRALRFGKQIYILYLTVGDGNKRAVRSDKSGKIFGCIAKSSIFLGISRYKNVANCYKSYS